MKRIVSLILALVMMLSIVPVASAAAPKFIAASMSELADLPQQPVAPQYTLEKTDSHYVLTVTNGEKYARP